MNQHTFRILIAVAVLVVFGVIMFVVGSLISDEGQLPTGDDGEPVEYTEPTVVTETTREETALPPTGGERRQKPL